MNTDTQKVYNLEYQDIFNFEDLEERRLFLNSLVDESIMDSLVYHIMRYNRIDKGKPVEERKPILIYINSPGGSVSDGFGLIDAILESATPVYTINQALCASMGFLIFIAGHKRYTMPHAQFLMHDGSSIFADSLAKVKDRMEFETGQLEVMTKNYVISHTKISAELYENKYRTEWWMLPKEAKEIGVAQYIIGEDCSIYDIL